MHDIVIVPDDVLRKQSQTIEAVDKKLVRFFRSLGETLIHKDDPPGVGISAVQVGKPIRAFYTYMHPDPGVPSGKWEVEDMELTLMVNPMITNQSDDMTLGPDKKRPQLEGCLSIPRLYGPVWRHTWVEAMYLTIPYDALHDDLTLDDFQQVTRRYKDFPARVVQHEFDHLEGVLFTDYLADSDLPLYLDDNGELVEVQDPAALLDW